MILAVFLLIISLILMMLMTLSWNESIQHYWYIPAFIAIACFSFLVSVTYVAQDCEDLGKFKSLNNIYQCQKITKGNP